MNSPLSNGTCERMMREVVRTLKTIIHDEWRNTRDGEELAPAVQWALNTALCERNGSTPYYVTVSYTHLTLPTICSV